MATHILEMLTMLEKVSAFTEVSRVSKSHLWNEDIFYNMPLIALYTLKKLAVIYLSIQYIFICLSTLCIKGAVWKILFRSDERVLCKKRGSRGQKRSVDPTEAGSQVKQSLGLFRMFFINLVKCSSALSHKQKKQLIYQTDERILLWITC